MTETIKQIVQKQLNQTPVHEVAESEPVIQHEKNEISSNNQAAVKHKKRKRKHKKVKIHKDPQQIKQIRLQRVNVKRQELWNDRFIKDTIPDLYDKAKRRRTQLFRKNKSPFETVYVDKGVTKEHKFPHLGVKPPQRDSIEKQNPKSFNIRTGASKKQPSRKKGKTISKFSEQQEKIKPNLKIEKSEKMQSSEKKDKLLAQENKLSGNTKPKEKLLAKLEQQTKMHPINEEYKHLLIDLINLQDRKKSKQLRTMIDLQISSIGHEKNVYTRIDKMIKQRKSLLKSIEQSGETTTLKTCLNLQITSVGLIEEILKFKAKWEEQYYRLQKAKKISYFYLGKNYLLLMKSELPDGDPFLVSRTSKLQNFQGGLKEAQLQQKKQIMLKIRACQLLLIEEDLTEEKQ